MLIVGMRRYGPSWSQILGCFDSESPKTIGQIKSRAQRIIFKFTGETRAKDFLTTLATQETWSKVEEASFKKAVKKHGEKNWELIAESLGGKRTVIEVMAHAFDLAHAGEKQDEVKSSNAMLGFICPSSPTYEPANDQTIQL